uniref:Uncharacterized protein n=1 Tax=Podoviridae sp. ctRkj24 TaxID=2823559 RepID=A0A8S5LAZ3_9CAUD|nr:MAG TPA: hypothetical protein [Podoviridae sp. ctRkj24]DAN91284.1 MAG TPA: hypothetical protein [Bacteriophage sp.]
MLLWVVWRTHQTIPALPSPIYSSWRNRLI